MNTEKSYKKDNFSSQNKKVCSRHFKPDDYEDKIRVRLTKTHS